ncbi:hypothetical protein DFAR_3740018 [Desulfarculales bacterium]
MGRNDRGGSRALDEDTAQTMVRLRRTLPTASMVTLISEIMRRNLTALDVILKVPIVYHFLHQQELMGKQVAPPSERLQANPGHHPGRPERPSHIQNLPAPGLQGGGQKPSGRRLPPGHAGLPPAPPQKRRRQTEPLHLIRPSPPYSRAPAASSEGPTTWPEARS